MCDELNNDVPDISNRLVQTRRKFLNSFVILRYVDSYHEHGSIADVIDLLSDQVSTSDKWPRSISIIDVIERGYSEILRLPYEIRLERVMFLYKTRRDLIEQLEFWENMFS